MRIWLQTALACRICARQMPRASKTTPKGGVNWLHKCSHPSRKKKWPPCLSIHSPLLSTIRRRKDTNAVVVDSSQGQSKLILSSSGVVSPSGTPSQAEAANTPEASNLRLDLIEVGWLGFKENEPNISTNPLPTHEGQSINTLSHKVLAPDQGKGTAQTVGQVAAMGQEWARPFQPLIIECDPIHLAPLIIAAPPKPAYKNNHAVRWQYDLILEELPKEQADDPPLEEITHIVEPGGITRSGRIYTPENLGKKNPKENPKGAPKEKEAEKFF
ncbi:hypothetical protein CR513_45739, partial [Mucuna pruriens]